MRYRCFPLIVLLIASSMPAVAQSASDQAKETIYTLESIVVTAEKLSEYMKKHPQRVVVLSREEIEERGFLGVGEALDSMSGVDVQQSGSGVGCRISIRGSGGSGKVLVLISGQYHNKRLARDKR